MARSGEAYILQGVPLNNNYRHTIYFSNESAQESFFKGKVKDGCHFTELSHLRVYDATMNLPIKANGLYNCNYVMFRNANKWIYAFITAIRYINDGNTEIDYEIDVIQTWFFQYSFYPTYVVREHAMSDKKWEYATPEPFPVGDFTYNKLSTTDAGKSWKRWYVIQSPVNWVEGQVSHDTVYVNGNLYAGFMYLAESYSSALEIIKKIQRTSDNGVTSVQAIPEILAVLLTRSPVGSKSIINKDYETIHTAQVDINHSMIGDYKPRNNKCFNYPYYSLYVSNQKGLSETFDFARMSETARTQVVYNIYGDISVGAPLILHLASYKGFGSSHDYDMILGTMPQSQFASFYDNSYHQQELQARTSGAERIVGSAIASGGNPAVVGTSLATNIINNELNLDNLRSQYDQSPSNVHNLGGTNNIQFNMGSVRPVFAIRRMLVSEVKKLDSFFDVYGYQTNLIKQPNISGRKQWNYVETKGCAIKGNLPAWANSKICNIHDSGITYWKNGNNLGNYSLDNTL